MHFAATAALPGAGVFVSWSGSLSASASTATVTGTSRTATVVGGGSRTVYFQSVTDESSSFQYSYNGGAFTDVAEGGSISVANGSTLQFKGSSALSTWVDACVLRDGSISGPIITSVSIARV